MGSSLPLEKHLPLPGANAADLCSQCKVHAPAASVLWSSPRLRLTLAQPCPHPQTGL